MKTTYPSNYRNRFFEAPDILQNGYFSLHLGFSYTCKWHFRLHSTRFLKTRVCVYPCGQEKWDWWEIGKMMVSVIAPVCYCSVYWKYTWNIKSRCINPCMTCSRSRSAWIPFRRWIRPVLWTNPHTVKNDLNQLLR